MINGITPVGWSSKCEHRFQIKPYGKTISEDLADHIRLALRRKPDVIAIHIGTNDITNNDCSSLQTNLRKIRESVTELCPSTKIVLSSIILRHGKSYINVKVNHRNETIKEFFKTNKLDLTDNSNIKDQTLHGKKKLYLNDGGRSLLANNSVKYFINRWLPIGSDSEMSLHYQRNNKNQNKVSTSSSNIAKR